MVSDPTQWTAALTLSEVLAEAPEAQDYLDWRGLETGDAWEGEETLGELCERWEVEWEELHAELVEWLENSTDESARPLVEWHERLVGGEE